jgi:hypothetical protein
MSTGSALLAGGAGRDLVAADIALGAGFGTTPVLDLAAGSNRSRGRITVLADATAAQATATVTLTFPEPFEEIPAVVCVRDKTDEDNGPADTEGFIVSAVTTDDVVFIKKEIPVDTEDCGFSYVIVG